MLKRPGCIIQVDVDPLHITIQFILIGLKYGCDVDRLLLKARMTVHVWWRLLIMPIKVEQITVNLFLDTRK